jgi:hypothetical protein
MREPFHRARSAREKTFGRTSMRNFLSALLASALLSFAGAAHAGLITYTATLSGLNEVPPNASQGIGFATVIIDDAALTMTLHVAFSGLSAPTTNSHIHCCLTPQTGTAGVATTVPSFAGFPSGVTAGTYDNTLNLLLASSYNPGFITLNGGTAATAAQALLTGMANGSSYLNIHTTAFPAGEIRGNLIAVPEPGGIALLALGGAMLLRSRYRPRRS